MYTLSNLLDWRVTSCTAAEQVIVTKDLVKTQGRTFDLFKVSWSYWKFFQTHLPLSRTLVVRQTLCKLVLEVRMAISTSMSFSLTWKMMTSILFATSNCAWRRKTASSGTTMHVMPTTQENHNCTETKVSKGILKIKITLSAYSTSLYRRCLVFSLFCTLTFSI